MFIIENLTVYSCEKGFVIGGMIRFSLVCIRIFNFNNFFQNEVLRWSF